MGEFSQSCRLCYSVCRSLRCSLGAAGDRPCGHVGREGDEHEDTGSDRRVDEVLADAAEQLLNNHDGSEAANDSHPERQARRQVHSEQRAGQDRTQVTDCLLFFCNQIIQVLKYDAGCDANRSQDDRPGSELVYTNCKSRDQRDQHCTHDSCRVQRRYRMRRR